MPDSGGAPIAWTAEQQDVIALPADARVVVDAGPGSGKTATAAGRMVSLIGTGLPPESLCALSFSRAAVAEMRERLLRLGAAETLPRVTTLDSLAWHLRAGDEDGPVLENYDRAVAETLEEIRGRNPDCLARLRALRHFLIDESQDLVGVRAALAASCIAALDPGCGVTVLTDEAQAIYGFSAGALHASFTADTLAQHLLDGSGFALHRLRHVHRTGEDRLLRLFAHSRARALDPDTTPERKLRRVRRSVRFHAHARRIGPAGSDTLILFRSRAEVLHAAGQRGEAGFPYRLRLSGLPDLAQPWLAVLAGEEAGIVPRWRFQDILAQGAGTAGPADTAWEAACLAAGQPASFRSLDLRALLRRMTGHPPPPELALRDPGDPAGPVLGTIHASKGREAAHVQLMLPAGRPGNDDPDGEARVLFVGATRARNRLEVGRGMALGARRLPGGRVYLPQGRTLARVEIGREGDFVFEQASPPGSPLSFLASRSGAELFAGGTRIARGTSRLLSDLGEIRQKLAGGWNAAPWSTEPSAVPNLGQGTAAILRREVAVALAVPVAFGVTPLTFS